VTRSGVHLLALVVLLKCFQRLGYFPKVEEIPAVVIQRVRGCLALAADISVAHDSDRTLRHHKTVIRARLGVPEQAREIAEEAIRTAADVKDNPSDLINVALEELIRARCELPGYTTLDELAAKVRAEVNGGIFRGIGGRMTDRERAALDRLLDVDPRTRRSGCDRLKQPAKAATLTRFREHLAFLAWGIRWALPRGGWRGCRRRRRRTSLPRPGCWRTSLTREIAGELIQRAACEPLIRRASSPSPRPPALRRPTGSRLACHPPTASKSLFLPQSPWRPLEHPRRS
jgi:hypothetical protein